MKYTSIVAFLDGHPDKHGDMLTGHVKFPETVQVTHGYAGIEPRIIGSANLKKVRGKIVAEFSIFLPEEIATKLKGGISGRCLDRDDHLIKSWSIHGIDLSIENADHRIPTLKVVK